MRNFGIERLKWLPASFAATLLVLSSSVLADTDWGEAIAAEWAAAQAEIEANRDYEAVPHIREAVTLARKHLPADDEQRALLTYRYGVLLLAVADDRSISDARARDILEEAVQRYQDAYGDDAEQLIDVWISNGHAARSFKAARRDYNRALAIARKHYGKATAAYYEVELLIGDGMLSQHASRRSVYYIDSAYEGFRTLLPETDVRRAQAAIIRATWMVAMGWVDDALPYLEEAVAGFEAAGASDSASALSALAMLSNHYERAGDSKRSAALRFRIGEINSSHEVADGSPLLLLAPQYPRGRSNAGTTGYVDLRLTVLKDGTVTDVVVTGGQNVSALARDATAAVEQFRYAPRVIDGKAIKTENVATRVRFSDELSQRPSDARARTCSPDSSGLLRSFVCP